MCDLIKLSTTVTIAPRCLWSRGSSYVALGVSWQLRILCWMMLSCLLSESKPFLKVRSNLWLSDRPGAQTSFQTDRVVKVFTRSDAFKGWYGKSGRVSTQSFWNVRGAHRHCLHVTSLHKHVKMSL